MLLAIGFLPFVSGTLVTGSWIGGMLPWLVDIVTATAVLAMGMTGAWFLSGIMGPRTMGGRPLSDCVDPGTAEALERAVKEYAGRLGMRVPRLYVIPGPAANALGFGVGPTAAVAITEGMAESLGVRELQAVLAHEMAHLRAGASFAVFCALVASGIVGAVAVVGVPVVVALLWVLRAAAALSGFGEVAQRAGSMKRLLIDRTWFICDRVVTIVAGTVSRQGEYAADRLGAQLAGRQATLAALYRIESWNAQVHMPGWLAQLYAMHPQVADRVAALSGEV